MGLALPSLGLLLTLASRDQCGPTLGTEHTGQSEGSRDLTRDYLSGIDGQRLGNGRNDFERVQVAVVLTSGHVNSSLHGVSLIEEIAFGTAYSVLDSNQRPSLCKSDALPLS